MPNIYEEHGLRFYFFSNERNEPPHIHVTDEESVAKFWLNLLVMQEARVAHTKVRVLWVFAHNPRGDKEL